MLRPVTRRLLNVPLPTRQVAGTVTARWASDGGVGDLSRQLKRLAVPATHDGEKPTGPARDHLASSHGVIQADAFTGYEALVCKSGPPTQIDLSAQTIKIAP